MITAFVLATAAAAASAVPAPASAPMPAATAPAAAPTSAETPASAAPKAAPAKPPVPRVSAKDLDDVIAEFKKFEAEIAAYQKEVQATIERKYESRKGAIGDVFENSIRALEVDERALRVDAIALFEKFVARYPDDRRFTADAMFRLAELYYEKSQDDTAMGMRDYEDKLKSGVWGDSPPPEPKQRYDRPIQLYRDLIARFPEYRLLDGVYYLLGYVYEKQDQIDDARDTYLALIGRFPKSRFVPEAWVRMGEYYFESAGADVNAELHKAIAAYSKVMEFPDHPLYDKAMYKLGWSYYRLADEQHPENFQSAVETFVQLIDFYAKQKALAQKDGKEFTGGDLRNEALQYTAISFADPAWGTPQKAIDFFGKLGPRPYKGEFFKKLGDVFYDETKHNEAIACYQVVLRDDPTSLEAPATQEKIILAYERDRAFDKANVAIEELIKNFGEKSAWAEANKHEPEILQKTRDLIERRLRSTATHHHQQAIEYKKAGRLEEMKAEFEKAAEAYGAYIARFPHAKDIDEVLFYSAETLYNSLRFAEAAEAYTRVRDNNNDNRYQSDAAYGAVLSFQREAERQQSLGNLLEQKILYSKDRQEKEVVAPLPIPPLWTKYIAAADGFGKILSNDERTPGILYTAAEIFYRYNQYDEARKRFTDIVKRWPASEVATSASNLTLETWLTVRDWAHVEESSKDLLATRAKTLAPDKAEELRKVMMGARFHSAEALMAAKEWEKAAKTFTSTVDEDPKFEFGDVAINNAAFCYQQELKHDSAMRTYERVYTQFPKSKFSDAALFLVGLEAEKAFDFDTAIARYETLVDKYQQSEKRSDALYNVAHLLERTQKYNEAARAYARYAQLFPDKDDTATMLFDSALVYEKMDDYKGEIRELEEFVKRFARDAKQEERIVDAHLKIAQAWKAQKNDAMAKKAYQDCASDFDSRKFSPEKQIAAAAAAEARYQLAEYEFAHYDELKIEGSGKGNKFEKSLGAALTKKAETRQKLFDDYKDSIVRYRRGDWIVCSLYRMGYLDERFAQSLYEAPVPREIKQAGEDYVNQYKDSLAEKAIPIEDRALQAYKRAFDEAKHLAIANDCTKRIQEGLDKYDHKNFPLLKEARAEMVTEALSALPMATTVDGIPAFAPTAEVAAPKTPASAEPAPTKTAPPPPAEIKSPAPPPATPVKASPPSGKLGGGDEK